MHFGFSVAAFGEVVVVLDDEDDDDADEDEEAVGGGASVIKYNIAPWLTLLLLKRASLSSNMFVPEGSKDNKRSSSDATLTPSFCNSANTDFFRSLSLASLGTSTRGVPKAALIRINML